MAESGDAKTEGIEPMYFLNNDIDQEGGKYLGTWEICMAVLEVVGDKNVIDAAQRIGGLWRMYLKDELARALLLSTGINLIRIQISLRDKNPFLHPGQEAVETTRLFMRSTPLSFDIEEITSALKKWE